MLSPVLIERRKNLPGIIPTFSRWHGGNQNDIAVLQYNLQKDFPYLLKSLLGVVGSKFIQS